MKRYTVWTVLVCVIATCVGCSTNAGNSQNSSKASNSSPSLASQNKAHTTSLTRIDLPFTHRSHLVKGDARECNRCHRSQEEGLFSTSYNCQVCHAKEKEVQITIGQKRRNIFYDSFHHASHLNNGERCTDCHRYAEDAGKSYSPVPFDVCKKCHLVHDTTKARNQGAEKCSECHFKKNLQVKTAKTTNDSLFSHKTHLREPDVKKWQKQECLTCHMGIVDTESLPTDMSKCKSCHQQGERKETWTIKWKDKPAVNYVFNHDQHLKQGISCNLCHNIDSEGDIGFRELTPATYQGCVLCHKKWVVSGHGKLDDCWKCHQQKPPHEIAVVEVVRERIQQVTLPEKISSHTKVHEFGDDCQKCHLQSLAKREALKEYKFEHRVHLEGIFSSVKLNEQCRRCHNNASKSDNDSLTMPNSDDCQKCHLGSAPTVKTLKSSYSRPVFSHKQHARTKGGCLVCHPLNLQKNPLKNDYKCSSCHKHREKDVTGKKLERCFYCHLPEQMWGQKRETLRMIASISGTSPTYRHRQTGKCRLCHLSKTVAVKRQSIEKIMYRNDPHPQGMSPESCQICHFKFRK